MVALSRSVDLWSAWYSVHWMVRCPEGHSEASWRQSPEPCGFQWTRGVKKDSRTHECQTAKGKKQEARAKGKYLKAKVCSRLRVVILVAMLGRIQNVLGQGRSLSAATVEAAGVSSGCHVKSSSRSSEVGDGDDDGGLIDELQGCSCLVCGATPGQDHRRRRGCSWAASGQNGCRRNQACLTGARRLIWKCCQSWHGRSRSHALVAGRVHASRSATCRR